MTATDVMPPKRPRETERRGDGQVRKGGRLHGEKKETGQRRGYRHDALDLCWGQATDLGSPSARG